MRLEVARITDASSVAHVSPAKLSALIKARAPRLAARALGKVVLNLDQLAEILLRVEPADEADLLLEDLHMIARVCLHDGAEDLLRDKGVALRGVTLGDALAGLALNDRLNFDAIADHAMVATATSGSTFTLFGIQGKPPAVDLKPANTEALKAACAKLFDGLGQGAHCDVRFFAERDEAGFLIDHAGAKRTERVINERDKPEVRQFRPFRHDVVLFRKSTGDLRILARSEKERLFYASEAGKLLTGSASLFRPREAFVLDAILQPGYDKVLQDLTNGQIERVSLRELKLIADDDYASRHVLSSKDVFGSIAAGGFVLGGYMPWQASFSIYPRVRNGRRCFRLTVWKGNKKKSNAPWSDHVVNDFIAKLRLSR